MFDNTFKDLNVLITGHTGFKGAWLSTWLLELGANVTGYSLAQKNTPNLFSLLQLGKEMTSIEGEILGIFGFIIGGLFWMLVPYLDRNTIKEKKSPAFSVIGFIILLYIIVMTALTYLLPG